MCIRDRYIPFGKLTIIQGNPGEGKTYFAMRLAAACTNRKPLPGMETLEPFNIIYQTAEDGLGDTVKPRLMEADADLEKVLVIDDRDTPVSYTHLSGKGGSEISADAAWKAEHQRTDRSESGSQQYPH